jgi:hypothetical protein
MKLTTVLTAVNNNPKYTRFIPVFIHQWKHLFPEMNIKIVFIGEIPLEFQKYSEYIVSFPEIPNVSTVYIAQTIRILYPAILSDSETTLITDIDMLPGNRRYYTDKLADIDGSKFVVMRPFSCVGPHEIAICYNAAHTSTWSSVFGIKTIDDIRKFLIENYSHVDGKHGGIGWNKDQLILYTNVMKHPHVITDELFFNRLDIYHHRYDIHRFKIYLETSSFSDAHMYADGCPWTLEQLTTLLISQNTN